MADQNSLQHLQELDQYTTKVLNLLTEADQDLQQATAAVERFSAAHPDNATHGTKVSDAIRNIQSVIASWTNLHNQLVGEIREAQTTAENRTESNENAN
jgi:predicted  nucleic acid-binding Zn-ribbon protein